MMMKSMAMKLKEMGQQASKEAAEMGCIEAAEELEVIAASITSEEEERGDNDKTSRSQAS